MHRGPRPLTAGLLAAAALLLLAGPGRAQFRPYQRGPVFPPNRMPGWDAWRIYPWSPYNYGRNPYNPAWYPAPEPYPVYVPSPAPVGVGGGPAYPQPAGGAGAPAPDLAAPDPTGPTAVPPPGTAVVRLYLPDAFAEVWFDGQDTSSTGTTRYYVTPELPRGKTLYYDVKVRWRREGRPVTEEREVPVRAGKTAVVDFTAARADR